MREWILSCVENPLVAGGILALGLGLIAIEFLRPGRVAPAAAGGVLAMLGGWSLAKYRGLLPAILLFFVPFFAWLGYRTLRAHRNKMKISWP